MVGAALLAGCVTGSPHHKRQLRDADLVVETTSRILPSDPAARHLYLSQYAAELDESGYGRNLLADLTKTPHYEDVLIHKAELIGADAASLRRTLDAIFKSGAWDKSYFACAAYEAIMDGRSVWLIVLAWADYGHFTVLAYDKETATEVGVGVYM